MTVDGLVHAAHDVEAIEDMDCVLGLPGDHPEVRLPHVAADEPNGRGLLLAHHAEEAQEAPGRPVLPDVEESLEACLDLLAGSIKRLAKRSGGNDSLCFAPPSRRRRPRQRAQGALGRRPSASRRDCRSPAPLRQGDQQPFVRLVVKGQMGGRLGWGRGRPRRGPRRGRPRYGRRPSDRAVRAERAPLFTHRLC